MTSWQVHALKCVRVERASWALCSSLATIIVANIDWCNTIRARLRGFKQLLHLLAPARREAKLSFNLYLCHYFAFNIKVILLFCLGISPCFSLYAYRLESSEPCGRHWGPRAIHYARIHLALFGKMRKVSIYSAFIAPFFFGALSKAKSYGK